MTRRVDDDGAAGDVECLTVVEFAKLMNRRRLDRARAGEEHQ